MFFFSQKIIFETPKILEVVKQNLSRFKKFGNSIVKYCIESLKKSVVWFHKLFDTSKINF